MWGYLHLCLSHIAQKTFHLLEIVEGLDGGGGGLVFTTYSLKYLPIIHLIKIFTYSLKSIPLFIKRFDIFKSYN